MAEILDFNDAQAVRKTGISSSDAELEDLKRSMADLHQDILYSLLPGGRIDGSEFVCGDINGRPGNSLKVSVRREKMGVGEDFATGEKFGDLIDVWMAVRRVDFPSAIQQISDFLGRPRGHEEQKQQRAKKQGPDIGPPVAQYNYTDAEGIIKLVVYRHEFTDEKGKWCKTFRVWNAVISKWEAPKSNRPLFNQQGILNADTVILTEGEKATNALIGAGIAATSAMGGAKAPTDKTDWSPLKGKKVLIWPDNDPPGISYAHAAAQAVRAAGVVSVGILPIPTGKPEGWDAANAIEEGINLAQYVAEMQDKASPAPEKTPANSLPFNICDWQAKRFKQGEAPGYEWLIEGVIPLGTAGMLAALGGVGKGLLTLDLALKVACPIRPCGGNLDITSNALGGPVRSHGAAVIFTAEDDQGEMHRRLDKLDPDGRRNAPDANLFIVPLPNAGGPMPIVCTGRDGPHKSPWWDAIREQLLAIPDLRLVVFDPLASFVHADINADPSVGAFVTGLFASLATETRAAVLVCHHMTKGSSKLPTISPEAARDMVRGSSALVDGLRWVYSMWPAAEDEGKRACRKLSLEWTRKAACCGAVVKSNAPCDEAVRTFIRQPVSGLLVDRTDDIRRVRTGKEELIDMLIEAICKAARDGRPFTQHGRSGIYSRRHELPDDFHELGRIKLENQMVQELLNDKRIVKAVAKGSNTAQWLDVPAGPFALGVGAFSTGANVEVNDDEL